MILIDTHPLVWFMQGERRLGAQTRVLVQQALDRNEALVAPISFWETAMLVRKGRVVLGQSTSRWAEGMVAGGLIVAALTPDIAVRAGELPDDIHGDPADRLIVATAQSLDLLLVTSDLKILAYARAGHLRAFDSRR